MRDHLENALNLMLDEAPEYWTDEAKATAIKVRDIKNAGRQVPQFQIDRINECIMSFADVILEKFNDAELVTELLEKNYTPKKPNYHVNEPTDAAQMRALQQLKGRFKE